MRWPLVVVALACACGPGSSFVEPALRSVACGNDEPIRIAGVPAGGFGGIRRIGDAYGVVTAEEPAPGQRIATYAVDPCGAVAERRLVEGWARPAGVGWVASDPAALLWAEHLDDTPTAMPIAGTGWLHSPQARGLFVVDEVQRELLMFATPDADAVVVATDIDPSAFSEQYRSPFTLLTPPYVVEGDEVWYVSETRTLVAVDLATGDRSTFSEDVRGLHSSTTGDLVAWVEPATTDGGPPLESTILRVSTGEAVRLPGAVRDLDFPGVVVTGFREEAFVHDLGEGRTRSVKTAASARVVRADPSSAWLFVEDAAEGGLDDIVHLDMTTGSVSVLAQGLAETVDARIDPFSDGLLVFAADADDPSEPGRVLRSTVEGTDLIAEGVSRFHQIASDGRVISMETDPSVASGFSLRIRHPDGTDEIVARDATLYDPLRTYQAHYPGSWLADLQGDVLYSIEAGPDRGLWRMPFD